LVPLGPARGMAARRGGGGTTHDARGRRGAPDRALRPGRGVTAARGAAPALRPRGGGGADGRARAHRARRAPGHGRRGMARALARRRGSGIVEERRRVMKRIVIAFVALLAVAGVTPAARAFDGHGATVTPPSSVFPVPRDPWR